MYIPCIRCIYMRVGRACRTAGIWKPYGPSLQYVCIPATLSLSLSPHCEYDYTIALPTLSTSAGSGFISHMCWQGSSRFLLFTLREWKRRILAFVPFRRVDREEVGRERELDFFRSVTRAIIIINCAILIMHTAKGKEVILKK